jgi:hypothetical protein
MTSKGGKSTEENVEDFLQSHSIVKPALTLLVMTTPSTLYNSINSDYIKSGFIPRFLMVETDHGDVKSKLIENADPDPELLEWIKQCVTSTEGGGNLSNIVGPQLPPDPVVIPFDKKCVTILDDYETKINERMKPLRTDGLDIMYGKTQEIAMRISLIVAVSCGSKIILPEHLEWAINYVDFYTQRFVERIGMTVSDNPFEATCKQVYNLISNSGTQGATERELVRGSSLYRGNNVSYRRKITIALENDLGIKHCPIEHIGAGKPRIAWVTEKVVEKFSENK